MKRYAVFLLLAAFLSGCALFQPILTSGDSPADKAIETLARVEVGLTVAYRAVEQEAARGVLTKAQLTAVLADLDKASEYVSKAHKLRREGLFSDALKDALRSENLLYTVNSFLAKRIKEKR